MVLTISFFVSVLFSDVCFESFPEVSFFLLQLINEKEKQNNIKSKNNFFIVLIIN